MARTQRLDQEKFPFVLILLLVLTSLGTISVLFFGSRSIYRPTANTSTRNANINSDSNFRDDFRDSKNDYSYEYQSLVRNVVSTSVLEVEVIYIIPGGGSGSDLLKLEYPEWCKQRVIAAHKHSIEINNEKKSIFLALSAGSLNAPNTLYPDNKIIFESQFMIAHLTELGVTTDRTFGDTMSWDTVTNALCARQFLEGLLILRKKKIKQSSSFSPKNKNKNNRNNGNGNNGGELIGGVSGASGVGVSVNNGGNGGGSGGGSDIMISPLIVNVFVSDFHAARVKATFSWVLGLEPSLLNSNIALSVHSVNSEDIVWDKEEFNERIKHETAGVAMIEQNKEIVSTIAELHAFLLLGPHTGLNSYIHNSYIPSTGAGWA